MQNRNLLPISLLLKGLIVCVLLAQFGCSTPSIQDFKNVRPGMNKSEVLELAGNPKRKGRQFHQDRWVYEYKSGEFYVFFSEGKVTYAGPKNSSDSSGSKLFKDVEASVEPSRE